MRLSPPAEGSGPPPPLPPPQQAGPARAPLAQPREELEDVVEILAGGGHQAKLLLDGHVREHLITLGDQANPAPGQAQRITLLDQLAAHGDGAAGRGALVVKKA